MKNIIIPVLLLLCLNSFGQNTGGTITPTTKFQPFNKPAIATGQRSLDAKYKYTDTINFKERSFTSVAEANSYIPTNQRTVGLHVLINTGGTLSAGVITGGTNAAYWYKDGITNGDLVLFTPSGSGAADTSIIRTSKYGAVGNGSTDDRTAIQNAINAAAGFGGRVIIDKPGTYIIGTTASGGITRGLTMAANVSLYIPPGVILKLKNSSVTNSVPVQVIHIPATATNVYIGWPGAASTTAGTIDGNVANQPGYTNGFSQTNGNYLIGSANGVRGIRIDGLNLNGVFSNTINIGGSNTYGNSFDVHVSNIYQQHFGEGMQIISADNVMVDNIISIADSAQLEGDIIELSHCRYFSVTNTRVTTSTGRPIPKGGSGVDCYASRYGTVSDFFMQGTQYGMQIETNFSDNTKFPDDISVSNGVMQGINFAPFWLTGGRIFVSNVLSNNSVFCGAQMYNFSSSVANFTFSNVSFNGVSNVLVADGVNFTGRNLTIHTTGPDASPISLNSCYVDIDGLIASGGTANTMIITGPTAFPAGRVVNAMADGMVPIGASGASPLNPSALMIEGTPPFSTTNGDPSAIVGQQIAATSVTLTSANIPNGTWHQRIKILGTYHPKIMNGAKIKLIGVDSITLSGDNDFINLEFGADSIWRHIGGLTSGGTETDPIFLAANPYIPRTYAENIFLQRNHFLNGLLLPSLQLSTRPAIGAFRIPVEINGSNYYDSTNAGGHLRLSAGGTSAKSYIDIAGTNGDANFSNNILMGLLGAPKFLLAESDAYLYTPLHLEASVSLADSSDKAITSKWFKQNVVGFGGGGGGAGGDVYLGNVNVFTQNNSISGAGKQFEIINTTNSNAVSFGFPAAAGGYPALSMTSTTISAGRIFMRGPTDIYVGDIDANSGGVHIRANGEDAIEITSDRDAKFYYGAAYTSARTVTGLKLDYVQARDSAIAAAATNIYFDSTQFGGTGGIAAPIRLKWGTKLESHFTASTYVIPDSVGYVFCSLGATGFPAETAVTNITIPDPVFYPNRPIRIRNATSATITLSRSVFFQNGTPGSTSLPLGKYVEIISNGASWLLMGGEF